MSDNPANPSDEPEVSDREPATPPAPADNSAPPPIELQRDENVDDSMTDPEEVILAHPEWGGAATLASAASYGTIIPGAMTAAHANQLWTVELRGEFSISNGGGPLDETFNEMFGSARKVGDDDDADDDGWADYVDAHERRAEAKREMEERWASEAHEFADASMTGAEWGEFAESLRTDTPLRRRLMSRLMTEKHLTQHQANEAINGAAEVGDLMSVPESERTAEQRNRLETLRQSPNVATAVQWGNHENATTVEMTPQPTATNAVQQQSVESRADLFASAPNLTQEHRAAVVATAPLDARPNPTPQVASTQPAVASPGANMSGISV